MLYYYFNYKIDKDILLHYKDEYNEEIDYTEETDKTKLFLARMCKCGYESFTKTDLDNIF
jgi:hypothetical protein